MRHGRKRLLRLVMSSGLMLLPVFTATAQFDGSYTGSFTGTATTALGPFPVSGSVTVTVTNNVITVTSPGPGSGSISSSGSANFSGTGGALNASYTFSGTFVAGVSAITASGGWSAQFSDGTPYGTGSASGTWTTTNQVTGADYGQSGSVPLAHQLLQNYPNPFNPSTTIKYELVTTAEVRLSVYDILGREVSVLVNEKREAGVYEVKFDGSNLESGVYFYRLNAGDYVQARKLLLVR